MRREIYKITKVGKVEGSSEGYGDEEPYYLGYWISPPVVGERFGLYPIGRADDRLGGISTSTVTEIIDENKFVTKNSIYQIQKL